MSERDSWPEAPSLEDPPGAEDEALETEVEAPEPEVESDEAAKTVSDPAPPVTLDIEFAWLRSSVFPSAWRWK